MRHDERHAALAAYAFWCKLEQTWEWKDDLLPYYETLFDVEKDQNMCPACVIAEWYRIQHGSPSLCGYCPCDWSPEKMCLTITSSYHFWQIAPQNSKTKKKYAGDIANIMRKWCENVGVIAQREEWK